MKGAKEFYEELQDGQEYVSALIAKDDFLAIPDDLRNRMYFTIRQINCKFREDETHCKLVAAISKAKKDLLNYEFDYNGRDIKKG